MTRRCDKCESDKKYVMVWHRGQAKLSHRVQIEEHLGRPLAKSECVHHKNGNRQDNRLENLQVMTLEDHVRLHHQKAYSKDSEILFDYQNGMGIRAIGRKYGVDHSNISRRIRRLATEFKEKECHAQNNNSANAEPS